MIVDLGTAEKLKQKYGYEEYRGQGFASLRVEDGKLVIMKERRAQAVQTVQELRESALLFQEGTSGAAAPIKPGHIYLARMTDRHDKDFQTLVKKIVIAYTPNESVTIRWQIL